MATTHPLGIDIGGTGIKGAPVDLAKGEFVSERLRIPTPEKSTPENVADVVKQIVDNFEEQTSGAPVGITLPSVVTHGIVRSAANIDKSWIDTNVEKLFTEKLGRPVSVLNDADAAGVAELHYGAAKDAAGLVLLTTLGTGIGTALLTDGVLVPNTEFGHIELDGHDAETRASAVAREEQELSWQEWATTRLQPYYAMLEKLLSPDLIVVGGGVSKKSEKFLPLLDLRAPIVPAKLKNAAGIVGAAWHAVDKAGIAGS